METAGSYDITVVKPGPHAKLYFLLVCYWILESFFNLCLFRHPMKWILWHSKSMSFVCVPPSFRLYWDPGLGSASSSEVSCPREDVKCLSICRTRLAGKWCVREGVTEWVSKWLSEWDCEWVIEFVPHIAIQGHVYLPSCPHARVETQVLASHLVCAKRETKWSGVRFQRDHEQEQTCHNTQSRIMVYRIFCGANAVLFLQGRFATSSCLVVWAFFFRFYFLLVR